MDHRDLASFISPTMRSMFTALLLVLSISGHVLAQATPQTITLQSRAVPRGPLLRSRALPATSEPLADFFLGTDLQ